MQWDCAKADNNDSKPVDYPDENTGDEPDEGDDNSLDEPDDGKNKRRKGKKAKPVENEPEEGPNEPDKPSKPVDNTPDRDAAYWRGVRATAAAILLAGKRARAGQSGVKLPQEGSVARAIIDAGRRRRGEIP